MLGRLLPACPGLAHGPAQRRLSCGMGELGSLPSLGRSWLPAARCPLCPMTCPNTRRLPAGAAPPGPLLSRC